MPSSKTKAGQVHKDPLEDFPMSVRGAVRSAVSLLDPLTTERPLTPEQVLALALSCQAVSVSAVIYLNEGLRANQPSETKSHFTPVPQAPLDIAIDYNSLAPLIVWLNQDGSLFEPLNVAVDTALEGMSGRSQLTDDDGTMQGNVQSDALEILSAFARKVPAVDTRELLEVTLHCILQVCAHNGIDVAALGASNQTEAAIKNGWGEIVIAIAASLGIQNERMIEFYREWPFGA